jgi:hypothetical protein
MNYQVEGGKTFTYFARSLARDNGNSATTLLSWTEWYLARRVSLRDVQTVFETMFKSWETENNKFLCDGKGYLELLQNSRKISTKIYIDHFSCWPEGKASIRMRWRATSFTFKLELNRSSKGLMSGFLVSQRKLRFFFFFGGRAQTNVWNKVVI